MSRRAIESLETRLRDLDVSLFAKDAGGTKAATTALQSEASRRPRACIGALPALEAALGDDNYAKRSAVVNVLATLAEQIAEANRRGQTLHDAPLDADPDADEEEAEERRRRIGAPLASRGEGSDDDSDDGSVDEESEDEELSEEEAAAKAAAKAAKAASAAKQLQVETLHRIISLLHARIHDMNSFTRIRALQQLTALVRARAITDAAALVATMRAGQDRLMDKTASVRKAAIQLITAAMEMNPFSAVLDLALFRAQLQAKANAFRQQCERVPAMAAAAAAAAAGTTSVRAPRPEGIDEEREPGADDDDDDEDGDSDSERKQKMDDESKEDGEGPRAAAVAPAAAPVSLKSLLSSAIVTDLALEKLRTELQILFHAVTFITTLCREVLPVLHELLLSKTHSDAIECVKFFVAAKQFQLSAPLDAEEEDKEEGAGEGDEDDAPAASPAAARKAQAAAQTPSQAQSLSSVRVTVESGLKKLAGLIWSREQTVRDAVLEAWVSLYLESQPDQADADEHVSVSAAGRSSAAAKKSALVAINSLVQLVLSASLADLTNMEEICTRLHYAGHVPPVLVSTLWELFASEEAGAQARAAFLTLINFFANASGFVMAGHVQELVSVGFSDAALATAPTLVRAACVSMQKWDASIRSAPTPAEAPAPIPAHTLSVVFARMELVLLSVTAPSVAVAHAWYSCAEQVLNTLFLLHDNPERYCESLLHRLAADVFTPSSSPADGNESSSARPPALGNAEKLARFLFLLAHTALRTLVHLETLEKDIKSLRNKAATASAQIETEHAHVEEEAPKKRGGKKAAAAAVSAPMATSIEDDLAATQAAEYELEQQREQAEHELVDVRTGADGLVSVWGPVVVQLVSNLPTYAAHPSVQVNAVLALCKLMCINVSFCEGPGATQPHLALLFGVLKSPSTCAAIKGNIIVAVGDLFLRFPNSVEPWSEHMYHGLEKKATAAAKAAKEAKAAGKGKAGKNASSASSSSSTTAQQQQVSDETYVRKNTLMVLTHLILNDMLKAKGPLAEIAKCTQDFSTHPRIAQLSRAFFQELNNKCGDSKATIYNILPDILSRLSSDPLVGEQEFQAVFKFLLGFVTAQKQVDSLIEKLLTRFELQRDDPVATAAVAVLPAPVAPASDAGEEAAVAGMDAAGSVAAAPAPAPASSSTLCRDLSYCLTQLAFSVASLKKMSSLFRCYAPKLGDKVTYDHFVAVLARARKSLVGKDGAKEGECGGASAGKEKDALEAKQLCDELEARLQAQHEKLCEEAATTDKARAARGKRGYGDKIPGEEEERRAAAAAAAGGEDSEDSEDEDSPPAPVARGGRGKAAAAKGKAAAPAAKKKAAAAPAKQPTRGGRKKVVSSDDDDDDDDDDESDDESVDEESDSDEEEEEETKPTKKKAAAAAPVAKKKAAAPAPAAKAPAKAPAKGRKKKVIESSSEDEDEDEGSDE